MSRDNIVKFLNTFFEGFGDGIFCNAEDIANITPIPNCCIQVAHCKVSTKYIAKLRFWTPKAVIPRAMSVFEIGFPWTAYYYLLCY